MGVASLPQDRVIPRKKGKKKSHLCMRRAESSGVAEESAGNFRRRAGALEGHPESFLGY